MQLSLPHRFVVATTCLLQLTATMATTTAAAGTSFGKEHHGKSSISATTTKATVSLLKEEVPPYSAFSSPTNHRTLQGNNNNNGSSDNTFCYQALAFADINNDRRVDGNEFVTFLKIMGPSGILMDVNTVDDLPEVLFHNFVILACMCLNNNGNNHDGPSDPSCCAGDNAHVPNIGVLPGEDTSTETQSYLDMVCFLTETSIDRYVDSIAATTTTTSPTIEPTTSATTDYPTMYPTTSAPTMIPTLDPTTENPTSKPTESPTSKPRTESPTSITTTENPSSSMQIMSPSPTTETSNPTTATTTTMPTETPTLTPTLPPTTTPTTTPTSSQSTPSPSTATTTTSSPTSSSVSTDTMEPTYSSTITDIVQVNYVVAIRQKYQELQKPQLYYNEQQEQQYIYYLLVAAMDRLATIVATRFVYQNDRRHERRRLNSGHHDVLLPRRLVQRQSLTTGFHVVIPTTIDGTIMSICPDFVLPSERCEDVFASIQLELDSNLDSPGQVIDTFQTELNLAIQNGELQTALDTVRTVYGDDDIVGEEGRDDSQVYIVTGLTEQGGTGSSGGGGGGQGGIGGSSVIDDDTTTTNGAVGGSNSIPFAAIVGLIVVIAIGVIFLSLLVVRKQKKHRHAQEQQQQLSTENDTDDDEDNNKVPVKRDLEQARPKSSKASKKHFEMGPSKLLPPVFKKKNKKKETTTNCDGGDGDDDESSHAGSSGWSSHNDVSSESSSDVGDMLRSTKAGKRTPKGDRTHLELDQAIENGDWAAVGVTAALLASQPDETTNERNKKKVEMFFTSDSGEKYQYETTQYSNVDGSVSSRGSSTGGGSRGSSTSFSGTMVSGLDSSAAFGSQSSSIVTTPSEARSRERRLAEIRGEVDELIEYVVPDERAHINEMMSHFQGNEEVLLETLRSMKEKSIAEKARAESHRLARQNIKQQNQQNKDGDEDKQLRKLYADAVDNTGAPADDKWINDIENRVPQKKVVSTEKNELGGVEAAVRGAIAGSIKGLKGAFGDSV